jgi:hypothetical protein
MTAKLLISQDFFKMPAQEGTPGLFRMPPQYQQMLVIKGRIVSTSTPLRSEQMDT